MPTSDEQNKLQWRSWKPDNLLATESVHEEPLPVTNSPASDAQFKAELARLRKQAEQQGYNQGLAQGQEEGKKQGYEAGFHSGHEAGIAQGISEAQSAQQAAMKDVEAWIASFKLSLDSLDSLIPSRLVQLALQAVQSLHGSAQGSSNTQLQQQIKQLMRQDPLLNGKIRLMIHPDDRPLIDAALGETLAAMSWELHTDSQLLPGGCRILTDEVELDATLETRWQKLCQLAHEELSA